MPNRISDLPKQGINCNTCRLSSLCLPENLPSSAIDAVSDVIRQRRPLNRGEPLFTTGGPFRAIYAVRSGAIKTATVLPNGDEHVCGFHLPGEILGLDALASGAHVSTAVALETSSVCEIPFQALERLGAQLPSIHQRLLTIMSREVYHERGLSQTLARRSAEQRLAVMLLSLSERFSERGQSSTRFRLPMSRHELANYLGLTPETMSRVFRRLHQQSLVEAEGKEIELKDLETLTHLADGSSIGVRRAAGSRRH